MGRTRDTLRKTRCRAWPAIIRFGRAAWRVASRFRSAPSHRDTVCRGAFRPLVFAILPAVAIDADCFRVNANQLHVTLTAAPKSGCVDSVAAVVASLAFVAVGTENFSSPAPI